MKKKRILDPKQQLFLSKYIDPKSDTFGNATQSALAAGYAQEYAENLTTEMPSWLSENLGDNKLILKALKNLDKLLGSGDERILLDSTKFTLSRLHKEKFSDRTELTGKDGKDLNIILTPEQKKRLAEEELKKY